jgi:hypothetical protein
MRKPPRGNAGGKQTGFGSPGAARPLGVAAGRGVGAGAPWAYCQKHTEEILAKPRVWAGAERIAQALLRRGHLSPRAVKQILGESFLQPEAGLHSG